jgi:hypothetical protein
MIGTTAGAGKSFALRFKARSCVIIRSTEPDRSVAVGSMLIQYALLPKSTEIRELLDTGMDLAAVPGGQATVFASNLAGCT